MPHFSAAYLAAIAIFVAAARFAPAAAWPWLRDAVGVALIAAWDPRALPVVLGTATVVWAARRWLPGRAGSTLVGLVLLFAGFVAVRTAQRTGDLTAPLGFGFFALRIVGWWLDSAQDPLPPLRSLLGWLLYFPTFAVGPVQRFPDWERWERRRRWDPADASRGLHRVLLGYAKVAILSFWLVGQVLPAWLAPLPIPVAGTLLSTLSLYFTFSGLSDVAVGLGRVGGQPVPENFVAPFFQTTLPGFWRGWHVSVSDWARTYVYFPLLSRTRAPRLAAAAAMATFALWHEFTVAYLAWGAWHALGLSLWYRWESAAQRWPKLSWLLTLAWVFTSFGLLREWPRGAEWYAR